MRGVLLCYHNRFFISSFIGQSFALHIVKSWNIQTVTSFKNCIDETNLEREWINVPLNVEEVERRIAGFDRIFEVDVEALSEDGRCNFEMFCSFKDADE